MAQVLRNTIRGLGRIFPDCITLSQAIAFNMFLAFFPMLLLILGVLSSTTYFHSAVKDIPERLQAILPPGSDQVVLQYFVRKGLHPWKWMSLGLAGTLIAGSQVMVGYVEGFAIIEGDLLRPSYWRLHLRALILLCLTFAPSLAVVVMTVFGKQARAWLIKHIGLSSLIHAVGFAVYVAIVFLLAMCVLVLMYRIGRPGHHGYCAVLPGAVVATVLWWAADISFGFYVRRMPYDVVYGGLAAAIGLLLWMYLTAIVVLIGAAYNAEAREALKENERRSGRGNKPRALSSAHAISVAGKIFQKPNLGLNDFRGGDCLAYVALVWSATWTSRPPTVVGRCFFPTDTDLPRSSSLKACTRSAPWASASVNSENSSSWVAPESSSVLSAASCSAPSSFLRRNSASDRCCERYGECEKPPAGDSKGERSAAHPSMGRTRFPNLRERVPMRAGSLLSTAGILCGPAQPRFRSTSLGIVRLIRGRAYALMRMP